MRTGAACGRGARGASFHLPACASHKPAASMLCAQAALLAMANGRDFTLKVKPLSGSCRSSSETADGAAKAPALGVLTILFRPAESDQLRAGMPHIGVPAWVGAGSTDDAVPLFGAAACEAGASGGAPMHPPRKGPAYYFGACVQSECAPGTLPGAVAAVYLGAPGCPGSSVGAHRGSPLLRGNHRGTEGCTAGRMGCA